MFSQIVQVVDLQTQGYDKQMFSCNCSGNLVYHATLLLGRALASPNLVMLLANSVHTYVRTYVRPVWSIYRKCIGVPI